jgi:hypothetical protein
MSLKNRQREAIKRAVLSLLRETGLKEAALARHLTDRLCKVAPNESPISQQVINKAKHGDSGHDVATKIALAIGLRSADELYAKYGDEAVGVTALPPRLVRAIDRMVARLQGIGFDDELIADMVKNASSGKPSAGVLALLMVADAEHESVSGAPLREAMIVLDRVQEDPDPAVGVHRSLTSKKVARAEKPRRK